LKVFGAGSTAVGAARRGAADHRAAIDWLNRIANRTVRFFGIETELWTSAIRRRRRSSTRSASPIE
jgi:hypothetical protein